MPAMWVFWGIPWWEVIPRTQRVELGGSLLTLVYKLPYWSPGVDKKTHPAAAAAAAILCLRCNSPLPAPSPFSLRVPRTPSAAWSFERARARSGEHEKRTEQLERWSSRENDVTPAHVTLHELADWWIGGGDVERACGLCIHAWFTSVRPELESMLLLHKMQFII
jgi:hypothetical protein